MPSVFGRTPALDELREKLRVHLIADDPVKIAWLVLEIYHEEHTASGRIELYQWIKQLAAEVIAIRKIKG